MMEQVIWSLQFIDGFLIVSGQQLLSLAQINNLQADIAKHIILSISIYIYFLYINITKSLYKDLVIFISIKYHVKIIIIYTYYV